jgi:hypothetical protein
MEAQMFTALAALSTVALMGLFARKNRREGWVRHREPMIENLGEADWKAHYGSAWRDHVFPDSSILPEISATPSVSSSGAAIDVIGFTQQLQSMEASLERLNAPVVNPALTRVAKLSDRDKVTSDVHRVL